MTRQDFDQQRLRTIIEEELGELVHLSELPATAIEDMAARLSRAIAAHVVAALPAAPRPAS